MRNPITPSTIASTSNSKKSTTPCCSKVGIKRGPWAPEEDDILVNYIKKEGEGRWRTLPKRAGLLRCGKSCRLRWMNYLRPCIKKGPIAPDEEDLILRLHRLLGNRWSLIAGRLPGRTDNEIKNYWNTHLSKKLVSQGIDPRTHKPLNPNPDFNTTTHDSLPTQIRLNKFQHGHTLRDRIDRTEATGTFSMVTNLQDGQNNQNLQVVDNGSQNWRMNSNGYAMINENGVVSNQPQQNMMEDPMNSNGISSSSYSQALNYDYDADSWEAEILAALSHDQGNNGDCYNIKQC